MTRAPGLPFVVPACVPCLGLGAGAECCVAPPVSVPSSSTPLSCNAYPCNQNTGTGMQCIRAHELARTQAVAGMAECGGQGDGGPPAAAVPPPVAPTVAVVLPSAEDAPAAPGACDAKPWARIVLQGPPPAAAGVPSTTPLAAPSPSSAPPFVKHAVRSRYAVVVPVGDGSRHEPCAWQSPGRQYDLILNYFGDNADVRAR